MKIVNTTTKEVLAHITTNHSMTLDEALELMEIKVMKTQEDYENENGYDYDELDLVED